MGQSYFAVDMGTTRTRAWLLVEDAVHAHAAADFGVRNVAAGETRAWLEAKLVALLQQTYAVRTDTTTPMPQLVLAAGMITSPQGIAEVPHCAAPAGIDTLRANVAERALGQWQLRLVPGVRTNGADAFSSDIMRGEETLCLGLLATGVMRPREILLTLGSHWKWIATDAQSRIVGSATALTGELIHSIQANTLLAASLPQNKPDRLNIEWLQRGRREAKRVGLGRALFSIRLLDQRAEADEQQRLSFLYGAVLEGELAQLAKSSWPTRVVVSGSPALAELWAMALEEAGADSEVLDEASRESAYMQGLKSIAL